MERLEIILQQMIGSLSLQLAHTQAQLQAVAAERDALKAQMAEKEAGGE